MLAEIAAANAAFAIIKEAVSNGGDLLAAGQHLFSYFDNKAVVVKEASKNKSFPELEMLRQQEEELRNLLIYQGRPGLWDDWLLYQKEAREEREAKEKEEAKLMRAKKKKIASIINMSLIILGVVTGLGVIGGAVWLIYSKGQF